MGGCLSYSTLLSVLVAVAIAVRYGIADVPACLTDCFARLFGAPFEERPSFG